MTTGTPLEVSGGATLPGIDFALERLGALAGTVTEESTGDPPRSVQVEAYDSSGSFVGSDFTDGNGAYQIGSLDAGDHFVRTDTFDFRDELYDDLPCTGSCAPSAGTPVTATAGTTTSGVDFALDRLGRILGRVLTASGSPVSSSVVAHDTSGTPVRSDRSSSAGGGYAIEGLPPGTYFVKTSFFDFSGFALQDELYDDLPCEPSCDVSEGVALPVALNGSILGVDFALAPCPADSFTTIRTTLYLSTHTEEACERLSAGTDTTVASGADVTFKAGRAVVLEDGFAVQDGAGFRVVIEPDWTDD